MRIVDLRELTAPISSPIANAYIDFSRMTCSLVAVVTDVVRDGKPVIGYGFNSNGRYGQGGLIRERFFPRLLEADPSALQNDAGDNLDPQRIWSALMRNEKPGGHGERRQQPLDGAGPAEPLAAVEGTNGAVHAGAGSGNGASAARRDVARRT